jgi:phospholipase C
MTSFASKLLAGSISGALALLPAATPVAAANKLNKIGHIIVIYEENHPFDGYFGNFPGANGLNKFSKKNLQVDENGKPYAQLPVLFNTNTKAPDTHFPSSMPNAPFNLNQAYDAGHPGYQLSDIMGDIVHRYYQEQIQIDNGKMDRFALVSDSGGMVMGYNDISTTYLYSLAQNYTLLDKMFHPAFGGSFLNHQFLVCACAPTDTGNSTPFASSAASTTSAPPLASFSVLTPGGNVSTDAQFTPAGYAVNTIRSVFLHTATDTNPKTLLAPQTQTNIGDLLDNANVNWAWYSDGYNAAANANATNNWAGVDTLFQYHHHPFAYFLENAPLGAKDNNGNVVGTAQTEAHRTAHLKDRSDFIAAIDNGTLPAVSFYKPIGENNQHPGYTNITNGDADLQDVIENHIKNSPIWNDTVIIITYDENGGAFDHVAPTKTAGKADIWGPGSRVPTIIVSPFAKKGVVDHTAYDQTAILKLIEARFGLPALGSRDAAQADLSRNLVLK